ncbi:MAG TPA: DUF3352 domain-containing protein [Solirubrobacteraceae bacterium]
MRRPTLLPPLLAPLLAVLVLAGCGSSSSSSGTEADPVSAVPAGAPLLLEATVRPQGALGSGALAAGKELTGQADPYLRLLGALSAPGSAAPDFKRDVAPWLGARAAMFVSSISAAGPLVTVVQQALTGGGSIAGAPFGHGQLDGAIVMDTSDAVRARSFLAAQAKRAGARATSYRGVSYEATSGGLAFGLVRRFAVIGSEAGLRGVIDTTQGGAPLSAAAGYAKLLASAPAGAIGHLYANPRSPSAPAARSAEAKGVLSLLGGERQTNVSAILADGSLALDIDSLGAAGEGSLLSADPRAAAALAKLPGESWLAIGIGDARRSLAGDVAGLQAFGSLLGNSGEAGSTLSIPSIVGGLTAPLKVLAGPSAAARRDFSSWMGAAGIFTAGSSLLELKGAVVIESTDAARSRAAVAKLGTALRAQGAGVSKLSLPGTEAAIATRLSGLPLVLDIAAGRGSDGRPRFVLGLGEQSVAAALAPASTLNGSAAVSAAGRALGEGAPPSLLLDVPTLVSLLEGVGLAESHSVAEVLPFLRAATTVSGGGHSLGGEVQRYRLVLGLRRTSAG